MRYKCCDLPLSAGKCVVFQYLFHGEISCYPVPVRSLKGKSSIIFFVDGKQTISLFLLRVLWVASAWDSGARHDNN